MAKKTIAPFDIDQFIYENAELVEKYMSKNTMSIEVPDFKDLPKAAFYLGTTNVISSKFDRSGLYTTLQKLEYIKCSRDIIYFTEKYVKIISIDDGIIPFKLYRFQKKLLRRYQEFRFNISMQCRQSGKTQTTATYILHYNNFKTAKTTAILANKASQSREILSRIQMSYENLPLFLQQGVTAYNKGSMNFGNRSEIFCAASTSSSVRGKSCSLVYIDECAFIPRDMEFYESTYPVISSGKFSRIIITSTPNGQRGLFFKLWTEALAKKNDYQTTMVKWDEVPGRDQEWKRTTINNTSEAQFKQEHELSFRGSQNSLINGSDLDKLVVHEIIEVMHGVNVYEEPVKGEHPHQYMMTVDVSRGVGGDYSTFSVFDISSKPFKQVATYRNNKISPILYPSVIYNTAMHYNKALVLVEINDIGEQTASILHHEYEYDNVLTTIKEKNSYTIGFSSDSMYGVRTTVKVKSVGIAALETMVRNDLIEIVDNETIGELGTFIPKNGSYEADSGAHDDMVMTLVLFAWASTQSYFIELTNRNLRTSVLETFTDQALEELTPFGIIDDEFGEFDGEYKGGEGWFSE